MILINPCHFGPRTQGDVLYKVWISHELSSNVDDIRLVVAQDLYDTSNY